MKLITDEIRKIIKNRFFIVFCAVFSISYFIQVYWAVTELFLKEYEWLADLAGNEGYAIKDLIWSDEITDIYNYAYIVNLKSCFIYPIYMYGRMILMILIPLMCIEINNEFNSKLVKLKVTYYGKYRYCFGKAVAIALIAGGIFLFWALGTVPMVVMLKQMYLQDYQIQEVCSVLAEKIPLSIGGFFVALIIIMLAVAAICYFVTALGYTTTIPFVGLMTVALVFIRGNVGIFFSLFDSLSYLLGKVLPVNSMCGFAVSSGDYNSVSGLVFSYYLWLIFFVGLGTLLLKAKKECEVR